ncbi:hypothetical protein [Variovorax paradoxus]|uniref:hypothetical protein n=1 Tax=Variovorax paradoxus TaxID=34073 RepID=UPI00277D1F8F|nr:hypothetical protein [Variovorax paradoxus]MDP9932530.1 hypothetical protein [Variovorax paradoxus]
MNAYLLHRVGRRRLVGFGLGFAVGLAFMWATSLAISGAQGMGHFLPEALTGTRAGASASKGPAGRNPFDEFDPKLGTPKSKPFDQFGVHTDPPKRFREMTVEEELDIQPLDPPQGATPNAKLDLQPLDPAQDAKPWEEYPKQAKDPKDPLGLFEKPATKRK